MKTVGLSDRAGEAYESYERVSGTEDGSAQAHETFATVRSLMSEKVGVVRTHDLLSEAVDELSTISKNVDDIYTSSKLTPDTVGLRNAVETATLVAKAACHNPESRGTHFMATSA